MLWYGHKYGLVPEADYKLLTGTCALSSPHPLAAGEWHVKPGGAGRVSAVGEVRFHIYCVFIPSCLHLWLHCFGLRGGGAPINMCVYTGEWHVKPGGTGRRERCEGGACFCISFIYCAFIHSSDSP